MKKQSIDFKSLGDKHKKLESLSETCIIPGIPVIARLDGRAFHTLTKNLEKPFDLAFISLMEETAKALLHEFNAEFCYVQSDEITLVWKELDMFDGRIQKLCSSMAGYASAFFSKYNHVAINSSVNLVATFDCRIWQVPDLQTCAENVMWREMDASKNSVNMLAHTLYSQKELEGLSTKKRIALMETQNVYWNLLEPNLKRGSIFCKKHILKSMSVLELQKIPEQYRPDGPIMRTIIERLNLDKPLTKIINKVEVLFYNNIPEYEMENEDD